MERTLQDVFAHLPAQQVPTALSDRIILSLVAAQQRQLRQRFFALASGCVFMLGYLALSWQGLVAEVQTSSFFSYLQLLFSDPDIVRAHMADFLYGMLESVPTATLLVACVTLFFFFGAGVFGSGLRHRPLPRRQVSA